MTPCPWTGKPCEGSTAKRYPGSIWCRPTLAALGKGEELAAVKEVLGQVPLKGRVVVADALLTQRKVCEQIVAGGGEYLLPVKENQPTLRRDLKVAFSPARN